MHGETPVVHRTRLRQWLKRSDSLRSIVRKMRAIRREVVWTVNAVRSGRFLAYGRNYATSTRLRNQKVLTFTINLPSFQDFHSLTAWLDNNSVRYQEGAYCIYLPPQKEMRQLFDPILSIYPPDSGLKILKDLKPPALATYVSTAVASGVTRIDDWTSCRPIGFLQVANYMYDKGIGPRVYDLIEIQTLYNNLTAYVVQNVAGAVPTVDECSAFLNRLDQLYEDQLLPLPGWRTMEDFRCPACRGNLIRDADTGRVLYVDFQSFMLRDIHRNILQAIGEIREDVHFGDTHWIRGGRYSYQSIPGLQIGQRDVNLRWNLIKQELKKQGGSIEGSVVFDVGCNAGMMIYHALTDGAAWAVGVDRPAVAASARKLLLALGMTRFDIIGHDISSHTDFLSMLPHNVKLSSDSVLFFLAMRKHVGFPVGILSLPFKYLIYEGHEGETISDTKNYLGDIAESWDLQIASIALFQDGDSRLRPYSILRRN